MINRNVKIFIGIFLGLLILVALYTISVGDLSTLVYGNNLLFASLFVFILGILSMNKTGFGRFSGYEKLPLDKRISTKVAKESRFFLSITLAGLLAAIIGYLITQA